MSRTADGPTHRISQARADAVRTVLGELERARSVILTTHVNADGDGIGCQAALLDFLSDRGIETWIVNPTPVPVTYEFLLPDESPVLDPGTEEAGRRCREASLCLVVDTGEVSRIGRINPLVEGIPKVVIDHHPPGERPIEGLALRDPSAAAAGELVFDLVAAAGGPWTPRMVDGLYVAILTDTGSFRFSNSTPSAHRVAAELIAIGAGPDELHRRVYGSHSLRRFRLLQRALATLDVAQGGRVAWMSIPAAGYRELGCRPEDLEGMVDVPREVAGSEIAILFRELDDGSTKLSFRSNGEADVNALAREFGGGGHLRASGAVVRRRMDEIIPVVLAAAGRALPDATDPGEREP
jgi:bifunctional oligoribonuclease and PAP phosphatase NrnA